MTRQLSASPPSMDARRGQWVKAVAATEDVELLTLASEHPSWRVRRAVAASAHAPHELLENVLTDSSHRVRSAAVRNSKVTPPLLLRCTRETHPSVIFHLINRLDTPTEVLASLAAQEHCRVAANQRLVADPRTDVESWFRFADAIGRGALATLDVPVSIQQKLARDDVLVTRVLARNQLIAVSTMRALSVVEDNATLVALASHTRLDRRTERTLSRRSQDCRVELAANPSTSTRTLRRLSRRELGVAARVAENPNTPPATLVRLSLTGSMAERNAAVKHPSLPYWAYRAVKKRAWDDRYAQAALLSSVHVARLSTLQLTTGAREIALLCLAANRATTRETILELITRVDASAKCIRGVALRHPTLGEDDLRKAAQLDNLAGWELMSIARHTHCPPDVQDQVLTLVALGGATGDPAFDPVEDVGHPGDPHTESEDAAIVRIAARGWSQALGRARAAYVHFAHQLEQTDLFVLAHDPSPLVRAAVLRYDPISADTIALLRTDQIPWLKDWAGWKTPGAPITSRGRAQLPLIGGIGLLATVIMMQVWSRRVPQSDPFVFPAPIAAEEFQRLPLPPVLMSSEQVVCTVLDGLGNPLRFDLYVDASGYFQRQEGQLSPTGTVVFHGPTRTRIDTEPGSAQAILNRQQLVESQTRMAAQKVPVAAESLWQTSTSVRLGHTGSLTGLVSHDGRLITFTPAITDSPCLVMPTFVWSKALFKIPTGTATLSFPDLNVETRASRD